MIYKEIFYFRLSISLEYPEALTASSIVISIHQRNLHKTESELTEENIQSEIDFAGIRAGMALDGQFDKEKDQKAFVEGFCELVIDKGNVHYIE